MDIVLLTPRRRFIANRAGLGYQMPLGLVLIGGPLVDAGHRVRLVDNDVLGLDDEALAQQLADDAPQAVFIGHSGSTAAHPVAMGTARALRRAMPETAIVYGGVYPSSAPERVLLENPAIDVIVRGEGEATSVELAAALAAGERDLSDVSGIAWRDGERIAVNPPRASLGDLDAWRPGWELVDWDAYRLFGIGRAAGMQFSRGCTLRCTYCGQWSFWRRWRHRSPAAFVDELERLARDHGVRVVWLADENFAADRDAAREVLELLAERRLGLCINLNITAADVVRDADLLPLYKRAGVDNVILGIESLDDEVVARVRKNNPRSISRRAVTLLREHSIVSLVNVIYGLENECPRTLWRTFRRLLELDPDVLNAVYVTPHSWTPLGCATRPEQVIQPDLERFDFRNQVLDTPGLRPAALFGVVKMTEALFHLRPRGLWRAAFARDGRRRGILRHYLAAGARVVTAEIAEFVLRTRHVRPGALREIPGYPSPRPRTTERAERRERAMVASAR